MNEYLIMIWAFYGRVAEAIYDLIHGLAPEAHVIAFYVAALWPVLLFLVIAWTYVTIDDRLTMRRIRRDIAQRKGQASILRDRSN